MYSKKKKKKKKKKAKTLDSDDFLQFSLFWDDIGYDVTVIGLLVLIWDQWLEEIHR